MTPSPSTLVAYCYDSMGQKIQARIDWLVEQRDALVQGTFGTGGAAASVINAGENGKLAGFQIDLSGPDALQVVSDAMEMLGLVPAVAQQVRTTHGAFACLER